MEKGKESLKDVLIRDFNLKLDDRADTVERLFCGALLPEGPEVIASVTGRFLRYKSAVLDVAPPTSDNSQSPVRKETLTQIAGEIEKIAKERDNGENFTHVAKLKDCARQLRALA